MALNERSRKYIQLIVMTGVFMSVLDSMIVNVALPNITTYFSVNLSESQWVMTTYPLVETALLIVFGKLAERTGKGVMFTAGLGVFTAASLLCGIATSLPELIVFRILQGIGASMLFSISVAISFEVSLPKDRGKMMGIIGSVVAIASMVGPPLGGFIVGSLGWQFIFFVNVPIGVVATLAAVKLMRFPEVKGKTRFDLVGAATLMLAATSLLLMVGQLADTGTVNVLSLAWLAVFIASLWAFIYWERKTDKPLLDISIFKVRRFSLACTSMVLFFVTTTMISILAPFYFEGVMGYSAEGVGLLLMVIPAVMMFGSPLVGRLLDKRPRPHYTMLGHAIRGIAMLILAFAFFSSNVYVAIIAFFLIGLGGSMFQSPNNMEVMSALPREQTGVASSVTATARNLGISLGPAIGTVLLVFQVGQDILISPSLASAAALALVIAGIISFIGAMVAHAGHSERAA
ncbi:MAG: putative transporter [Methanomassiliicoccales archaeon PtaU1.Bin124]|nr:MAG: putative transporter [Methanomassiliicoccales archaeon PtaU1.Bin124]